MAFVDYCGFVSGGVYSETYGSTGLKNLCNLFAFYGMIEDAPGGAAAALFMHYFRMHREE